VEVIAVAKPHIELRPDVVQIAAIANELSETTHIDDKNNYGQDILWHMQQQQGTILWPLSSFLSSP
jgi:hypothetical protein